MRSQVVNPMFNLIRNENMKIYRRSRTWVMMVLLVIVIALVAIVMVTHQPAPGSNWKQNMIVQTDQLQQEIAHTRHMPAREIARLQAKIKVNQYDIVHNMNPSQTTGWGFAATAENIAPVLIAFILVVAGDSVASEFSSGTIKMLLTQPATRAHILLAKYLALLMYSLFATIFMFVCSVLLGWIFFGIAGAGAPEVYLDAHQTIQQMSVLSYVLMQYGFLWIQIVMTATIAFMISAIFRSSALAITISLLAFLIGSTVVSALSSYSWVKYILFANTDLSQFVVNGPSIQGLTLGFSISILVAYFIVMNILAWVFFVKRDVAYT